VRVMFSAFGETLSSRIPPESRANRKLTVIGVISPNRKRSCVTAVGHRCYCC
jgi:hypothetical protein